MITIHQGKQPAQLRIPRMLPNSQPQTQTRSTRVRDSELIDYMDVDRHRNSEVTREVRTVVNFYNDQGAACMESGVIPHFNFVLTRYFEASVQMELHARRMHIGCDYFGLVSWKLKRKTGISPAQATVKIEADTDGPDYYFAPLRGCKQRLNPWNQAEMCHPGIKGAAARVFATAMDDPQFME